jgi:dienelactone hydrolase
MNRREALKGTAMIMGFAFTGSTVAALMQSCESTGGMAWKPEVLNEHQARTLSAVVDRILPSTATPGALDVGVDQFIDRMLQKVFPENLQQGFAGGLDEFNATAKSKFGKDYL